MVRNEVKRWPCLLLAHVCSLYTLPRWPCYKRTPCCRRLVSGNAENVYRMSQEERSIFWKVIVSIILSRKLYMNICPIPNGFRDGAIWMQTAKLLVRKRYYEYVLFLMPVFIVQVTELVQLIIKVRKFHRLTCFRQWRSRAGGRTILGTQA